MKIILHDLDGEDAARLREKGDAVLTLTAPGLAPLTLQFAVQ